jgi:hypothetical protein
MARWVHRQMDARDCGAGTVTQCTNVRVNSRFISIQDDTNTHRGGSLIATDTVGKVNVNGKPVILIRDPAKPDSLCPGSSHCNPKAKEASPNVRAGNGS